MPSGERDVSVRLLVHSFPSVFRLWPLKPDTQGPQSLLSLTSMACEQLDKVSVVLGNVGDCEWGERGREGWSYCCAAGLCWTSCGGVKDKKSVGTRWVRGDRRRWASEPGFIGYFTTITQLKKHHLSNSALFTHCILVKCFFPSFKWSIAYNSYKVYKLYSFIQGVCIPSTWLTIPTMWPLPDPGPEVHNHLHLLLKLCLPQFLPIIILIKCHYHNYWGD